MFYSRHCQICLFLLVFLFVAMAGNSEAVVIQTRSWTRSIEPVVFKASAVAALSGQSISDFFVWTCQNNSWEQVVFQVDEMAANPGWSGYTPNPFINYFLWDDLDNGPDQWMGDGLFSNEDEIVFMASALGDRVSCDDWPPAVPVTWNRFELQFIDPMFPEDIGWVYLFRDNTSPAWTSEDYVDWIDETGLEKTVDAAGYRLSYISDGPGSWTHSPTIDQISIKPGNGGDDLNLLDAQKFTANIRVWIFDVSFCQSDSGVETYFQDESASRPHWVWGVKDGPVRVIRQYRMRGQVSGSQWGYHPYYTAKYYPHSADVNERFYINTTMPWNWGETSFDHNAAAIPLTYRDQLGNTGLINGNNADDSVSAGNIPDWVLVTSSHGSYHLSMDVETVQASSMQNVWNDNGPGATEAATCQNANGRYGDFGYRWITPVLLQNTYLNWYYTFLPDTTEDTQASGEAFYNAHSTPVPAPTVTEQSYIEPTVTPTSTETPSPSPTESPTLTPTVTETAIPTLTPSETPVPTETWTPVPTDTPLPTETPVPTLTPTVEPTPTGVVSDTPTAPPSGTPVPIPATGTGGFFLMLFMTGCCLFMLGRKH